MRFFTHDVSMHSLLSDILGIYYDDYIESYVNYTVFFAIHKVVLQLTIFLAIRSETKR